MIHTTTRFSTAGLTSDAELWYVVMGVIVIATQVVLDVFYALLLCTRKTPIQREIQRKGAG